MRSASETVLRAALATGPAFRFAAVFGSVAAGRARADSDLDLALMFVGDPRLSEELDLQVELERVLGMCVDLVRLDRASTLLKWQVASTGKLIAGERDEWVRFQSAAASEWSDFRPSFEVAAERFRSRLACRSPSSARHEGEAR